MRPYGMSINTQASATPELVSRREALADRVPNGLDRQGTEGGFPSDGAPLFGRELTCISLTQTIRLATFSDAAKSCWPARPDRAMKHSPSETKHYWRI